MKRFIQAFEHARGDCRGIAFMFDMAKQEANSSPSDPRHNRLHGPLWRALERMLARNRPATSISSSSPAAAPAVVDQLEMIEIDKQDANARHCF